jgi:hypothetical protein
MHCSIGSSHIHSCTWIVVHRRLHLTPTYSVATFTSFNTESTRWYFPKFLELSSYDVCADDGPKDIKQRHVMYLLERVGTKDKLDKKIMISVVQCHHGVNKIND